MKMFILAVLVVPMMALAEESPKQCERRMNAIRAMCLDDCEDPEYSKQKKNTCYKQCGDEYKKNLVTDCGLKPDKQTKATKTLKTPEEVMASFEKDFDRAWQ